MGGGGTRSLAVALNSQASGADAKSHACLHFPLSVYRWVRNHGHHGFLQITHEYNKTLQNNWP